MIKFENVSKVFSVKDKDIHAVRDMSFTINDGEIFGVIGLSGAGKSTLVRCMNLLERPTTGKVYLNDVELTAITERELRKERKKIGMIFQQFNLLEQRTALKNVCYPLEILGVPRKEAEEKAIKLLKLVGLEDRMKNYPAQLSGGQKQRVAIARALATDPEVLLCDEATSALDPNTTNSILDLLKQINESLGVTIVIITHEMKIVQKICHKVAIVDDGNLVETGDVHEVFLHPQSRITKNLIQPSEEVLAEVKGGKIYRLSFDGQESREPVVAQLVLKCQAAVNIWGASTENIGGKVFGQMLVEVPDEEFLIERVEEYLKEVGVSYEEVSLNGN